MDSLKIQRRTRLRKLQTEAEAVAQTAARIAGACAEAQASDGLLEIQQQTNFLTGALARMQKDLGVVEHLQAIRAEVRNAK